MHFLTAKTTKQTAFLMPLEIPFSEWACDVTQVKKLLECSIGEITFLAKLAYSTDSGTSRPLTNSAPDKLGP